MKIEIKNRWNGNIIITGEYESIKDALQKNTGADLRDADLIGAKGIILPIITIMGTKHTFFYTSGSIQIGCERWTVDYWLENYQVILEVNNYTSEQIAEYKTYIDIIANLKKEKK